MYIHAIIHAVSCDIDSHFYRHIKKRQDSMSILSVLAIWLNNLEMPSLGLLMLTVQYNTLQVHKFV